jgi:LDH2 family malate/lactate/ureidoglycolate dehydrogenase
MMKIAVAKLEAFCINALRNAGVSEDDARTTAEILVLTDTWGVFTHGTKNLRGYIRRLQGGGIRKTARPRIVREGPGWAIVDADSGLGMIGSTFAMRTAMAKARSAGIAYVGVRNSCHFGAAGCYATMAVSENMIGLAMANDTPTMTVPGGRGLILGNNPFACAIPTGEKHPILLDIAMSVVAGGKVFAAAAKGETIPETWMVDSQGRPTTDPTLFPHAGALQPMAGHKGYGLALMIETLSAILTGASIASHVLSWSFSDPSLATGHGAAFIAVDVNALTPVAEFARRMKQTIQEIRAAPTLAGSQIYLPGEMEWALRETALREGIEMPEDVLASLRSLGTEMGLDLGSLAM